MRKLPLNVGYVFRLSTQTADNASAADFKPALNCNSVALPASTFRKARRIPWADAAISGEELSLEAQPQTDSTANRIGAINPAWDGFEFFLADFNHLEISCLRPGRKLALKTGKRGVKGKPNSRSAQRAEMPTNSGVYA